jgi:hypothetical protein
VSVPAAPNGKYAAVASQKTSADPVPIWRRPTTLTCLGAVPVTRYAAVNGTVISGIAELTVAPMYQIVQQGETLISRPPANVPRMPGAGSAVQTSRVDC